MRMHIELRPEGYSIALLAVQRGLGALGSPSEDFVLQAEDVVVLPGPEVKVYAAARLFGPEPRQSRGKERSALIALKAEAISLFQDSL